MKAVGCAVAAVVALVVLVVGSVFAVVGALAMDAEEVPIPPELEAAYRQVGARTGVHWAALATWDAAGNQFVLPIPTVEQIFVEKVEERLDRKRRRRAPGGDDQLPA